jgi:glycosyltransferase involved in cell wall biosynthesis
MNHKRSKKAVAWWLYQRRDLKQARCHHATAGPEAQNLRRLELGVPVRIISNGVDVPEARVPDSRDHNIEGRQQRTALFLGRIYPVKGLPMLIDAWARVRPDGWVLKIAGPDEAGHRAQVESLVVAFGLSDKISFVGPVSGEAKRSTFSEADLFVLSSHSESFGMAIAEALAHGLPVLTTRGAPWPMLQEQGCGWWVDGTVHGLTEGLRQATSSDSRTLQAMGARGHKFITAQFGWESLVKQYIAMYEDLAHKRRHCN